MDKIKIVDNKAFALLKEVGIHKDLLQDVDEEVWIPINKKVLKIENVKIIIKNEEIMFEIGSKGDELVEKVIDPALKREEKQKKEKEKLPEVYPFSEENLLHQYETKLKNQKFYIGEATLRKYPVCETMFVKVSYGYEESRKTIKKDVKGLYISFSGTVWGRMGAGRNLVWIKFSRLCLHTNYTSVGKLRLTAENTVPISSMSEYKGNRFFDLRTAHNNTIKTQIPQQREMNT